MPRVVPRWKVHMREKREVWKRRSGSPGDEGRGRKVASAGDLMQTYDKTGGLGSGDDLRLVYLLPSQCSQCGNLLMKQTHRFLGSIYA